MVVFVIANILSVLLVAVLVQRKLHNEYPFFYAYILFSIVDSIAITLLGTSSQLYFNLYWLSQVVYAALSLLALQEVFRKVFRPFYDLFRWFWLVFPGATVLILAASVSITILYPPLQPGIRGHVYSFAVTASYIELGLFCLFYILMIVLGIRWRSYAFGIIQGFAISAVGDLMAFGLRYVFGTKYRTFSQYAPPVAFLIAIIVWLNTFLRPREPEADHHAKDSAVGEQESFRTVR